MEPSVHRLAFDADADRVLSRVEAVLAEQGDPTIQMRRVLVFESAGPQFMLRCRVIQALSEACDHDSWQRMFRPLD